MPNQPLAFISYSWADADRALAVAAALKTCGIGVWMDEEQIRPGDPVLTKISSALDAADAIVVLISSNSVQSPWCRLEYEIPLSREIRSGAPRVIPIRLDDSEVPTLLQGKAAIDLSGGISAASVRPVALAIQAMRVARAGDLAPVEAPRPEAAARQGSAPFLSPQLPMQFVPRQAVQRQLEAQVLGPEQVERGVVVVAALHGLGGVGKSTLAASLCHSEAIQARFVDGVLWATLGEEPDILDHQTQWIRALGDREFKPTTTTDASARLRLLLAGKSVLLVVDDVWDEAHARYFLLGGSHSRAVLTTRRAHIADGLDASLCPLHVMDPGEARELVEKWIKRPLRDEEVAQARAVLAAVQYHPLAVKLLAAGIARGMDWETVRYAVASRPERHPAGAPNLRAMSQVDACLGLSLGQLRAESEERWRQFAHLGLLAKGAAFDPEVAGHLWGMAPGGAAVVLENLADDAFMERRGRRFILHDLMHDQARRILASPPPEGLAVRLEHAHREFLDRLRASCGGDWEALLTSEYLHRFLAWHMDQGRDFPTLQKLLTRSLDNGRNAWFSAKLRVGDLPGFQTDVQRALRLARDGGEPVVDQVRYALMLSTLRSSAGQLTPDVVRAAVSRGVWSVAQGLSVASRLVREPQQGKALLAVLEVAAARGGEPEELLRQGELDALERLGRAKDLRGLARLLGLGDDRLHQEVVARLGTLSDEARLKDAVGVVADVPSAFRAPLVDSLLRRLDTETGDDMESLDTLVDLLSHLDDNALRQRIPVLLRWMRHIERSLPESRFSPPADSVRPDPSQQVADAARSDPPREAAGSGATLPVPVGTTAVSLGRLVAGLVTEALIGHTPEREADEPSLPEPSFLPQERTRRQRLDEIKGRLALQLADRGFAARVGSDHARLLRDAVGSAGVEPVDAAPALPLRPGAATVEDITRALARHGPSTMESALRDLLSRLPESDQGEGHRLIAAFLDAPADCQPAAADWLRWHAGALSRLLVALASHLPPEWVRTRATERVQSISAWETVSPEVLELLPLLAPQERESTMERMLQRFEQTRETTWRQRMAELLMQSLPAGKLQRVLEARGLEDYEARARFFITVAGYLPHGLPEEAVASVTASVGGNVEGRNIRTIMNMVRRLSAALDRDQLGGFVQEARRLVSEWWIVEAVHVLARQLADRQDLGHLYDAMQELGNLDLRARAQNYVVGRLAALGHVDAALQAVQKVELASERSRGLADVTVRMAERGAFADARRAAEEITDGVERSRAQALIALHMAQWGDVFGARALAAAIPAADWRQWATTLIADAEQTSGGPLPPPPSAGVAQPAPEPQPRSLASPAMLRERAADGPGARWWNALADAAARADGERWLAIQGLLLGQDADGTFFLEALAVQERPAMLDDLALVATVVGECGQQDQVLGICTAVQEVTGWWP